MTLQVNGFQAAANAATAAGLEVQEHSQDRNYRSATLWRNGRFVGAMAPAGSFGSCVLTMDLHHNSLDVFAGLLVALKTEGSCL